MIHSTKAEVNHDPHCLNKTIWVASYHMGQFAREDSSHVFLNGTVPRIGSFWITHIVPQNFLAWKTSVWGFWQIVWIRQAPWTRVAEKTSLTSLKLHAKKIWQTINLGSRLTALDAHYNQYSLK